MSYLPMESNPLPKEFDDAKFLTIPLVQAERAWGYGMQLKLEYASGGDARARLHAVARFIVLKTPVRIVRSFWLF